MSRAKRISIAVLTSCALGLGVVAGRAQETRVVTPEQILDGITGLQRQVDRLQSSAGMIEALLAALQNDLPPAIAVIQANTRFTPVLTAFAYSNPVGGCSVLNVSAEKRTVVVSLVNTDQVKAQTLKQETFTLDPGRSRGFGLSLNHQVNGVFCSFTVIDGTRADIRATGSIRFAGTGHPPRKDVLAAE